MWATIGIAILEKLLLPLALEVLKKSGVLNGAEVAAVKVGEKVITTVESVKVEDTYPTDTALRGNNISTPR